MLMMIQAVPPSANYGQRMPEPVAASGIETSQTPELKIDPKKEIAAMLKDETKRHQGLERTYAALTAKYGRHFVDDTPAGEQTLLETGILKGWDAAKLARKIEKVAVAYSLQPVSQAAW